MNNETIGNLRGEIIHSGARRGFHPSGCRGSKQSLDAPSALAPTRILTFGWQWRKMIAIQATIARYTEFTEEFSELQVIFTEF